MIEQIVQAVIAAIRGGRVLQGRSAYTRRHASVGPYQTAVPGDDLFATFVGGERRASPDARTAANHFVMEVGPDEALDLLTRPEEV